MKVKIKFDENKSLQLLEKKVISKATFWRWKREGLMPSYLFSTEPYKVNGFTLRELMQRHGIINEKSSRISIKKFAEMFNQRFEVELPKQTISCWVTNTTKPQKTFQGFLEKFFTELESKKEN